MVAWVMAHLVEVSAIGLALLRLLEAVAIVLPEKPKGVLEFIVRVVKEIFRFG